MPSKTPPTPAHAVPLLEPELALALALQAAPGAYSLLVGSGLSTSAGIPTAWEVMVDLMRHIAPPGTETTPEGLEQWYRAIHAVEPNYSGLLQAIAPTPAERSVRLRDYFEPTEEERAEGRKVPTKAHHAIARLVASGYVRVIVTTNFDQLLETALRDAGVTPAVISSADGVAGAMPIQHQRVTVLKLHGDYMDMRLKNTAAELSEYESSIRALLARVVDEYGLVVCGWSAAWDDALRATIMQAPPGGSRRSGPYTVAPRQRRRSSSLTARPPSSQLKARTVSSSPSLSASNPSRSCDLRTHSRERSRLRR